MSAPSYLNTDFTFIQLTNVTDTQTIVDAAVTMLTSTLPTSSRWVLVSGSKYQSPSNSADKYMQVDFAKTSTTRMTFAVSDHIGQICDRRIDIAAGGSTVEIFAGPSHFVIANNNAGTWEIGRAFLADTTPEANEIYQYLVYCNGYRNNSGSADGVGSQMERWMFRNYIGTATATPIINIARFDTFNNLVVYSSSNRQLTESSANIVLPYTVHSDSASEDIYHVGKLPQLLTLDYSIGAVGTNIELPIDDGVIGTFRIIYLYINNSTTNGAVAAIRAG